MHKYLITALMALVFAIPGIAKATALHSNCEAAFCTDMLPENPEMDPQLVEAILRAAAEKCAYSYLELNDLYDTGVLAIDKVSEGYRVADGGGMILVLMEDDL